MKISKSNAVEKSLGESGSVVEYPFDHNPIGIATCALNKRYPEVGYALNTVCDQIYLVLSGAGTILYKREGEDSQEQLSPGDAVLIKKNIAYTVDTKNIELVITNSPERNTGQYKLIEEK